MNHIISLYLIFIFTILSTTNTSAQSETLKANHIKNRVYAYWGWNRGYFTNSDIHFSGDGFDFMLKDVIAKDRQSEFSFRTYFHPAKLTIPQTNYGIGFYF